MRIDRTTAERLLVTLASTALLMSVHPPAQAHHRPRAYCSESGDICQSVRKVEGTRKLTIVLSSRFFKRYVLCVDKPGPIRVCETFRIKAWEDGTFGSSINLRRHFGSLEKGRYTVNWYRVPRQGPATKQIGKKLGFHI